MISSRETVEGGVDKIVEGAKDVADEVIQDWVHDPGGALGNAFKAGLDYFGNLVGDIGAQTTEKVKEGAYDVGLSWEKVGEVNDAIYSATQEPLKQVFEDAQKAVSSFIEGLTSGEPRKFIPLVALQLLKKQPRK